MQVLRGHNKSVRCVAYSPDGKLLATCGADQTVRLWDRAGGKALAVLRGHNAPVFSVAFTPDGSTLFTGGGPQTHSNQIRCWELPSGKEGSGLSWGHNELITCLAHRIDIKALVAGSSLVENSGSGRASVACYRFDKGKAWRFIDPGDIYSLALSCDGKWAAWGQSSRTTLYEWKSKNPRRKLPHPGPVWAVAFSPDSSYLATASGKFLRLFKVSDPTAPAEIGGESHGDEVRALSFAPDGALLASGDLDGDVILWDMATSREHSRYNWQVGPVNALAFAPDGMTLAVAGDSGVVVCDVDGL